MKYFYIIGLLFLVGIHSSCNNDNISQDLNGIYTETTPIAGRSQLKFFAENQVIKSESGNYLEDVFNYEIIGNVIKLTPTGNNSTPQEFEIQIINNSKFEIENLYPSVGINPTSYMSFEK